MQINFVNDWKSSYGFALCMFSWFKLDEYRSFTIMLMGIGFSLTRGKLLDD